MKMWLSDIEDIIFTIEQVRASLAVMQRAAYSTSDVDLRDNTPMALSLLEDVLTEQVKKLEEYIFIEIDK